MCVDVMYVDLSSSLYRLFVAFAVADVVVAVDVVVIAVISVIVVVVVVVVAVIPWNIIRYNFLL